MRVDLSNIKDYGLVAHLMLLGHTLEKTNTNSFKLVVDNNNKASEDCKEYFTFYKKRLDMIKKLKKELSSF
jgi:hypothetical protein